MKKLQVYETSGSDISAVKKSEVLREFVAYENEHMILQKIKSIKEAVGYVRTVDTRDQGYYILRLNRKSNQLVINPYSKEQLEQATENYDKAERTKDSEEDVVLVSTASYNMLKQAYPNYFSDITEFITLIESFLK